MSAGKSSVINALIGKELLPTGNEATTAKVARIIVTVNTKSSVKAYCHTGSVVIQVTPYALRKSGYGTDQTKSQALI
ncbi:dynamin family protein [Providencia rettgeri]|nr:dynamin family protein [Providencia rettgeri]